MFDALLGDALCVRGEVHIPHPAAGKLNQLLPITNERKLEDYAHHAVVVVLDLTVKAFARFEHQRFCGFNDRRTLVANVVWQSMLKRRLLHGLRTEDFTQAIEADLFTHVELNEDEDGTAKLVGWMDRGLQLVPLRSS